MSADHFERILVVCGEPNAGKSHALRSMFEDHRFGTNAAIPTSKRIPVGALSRERCLHVRCTSPHESGQSADDFLNEVDRARRSVPANFRRFNYACAMQPHAHNLCPSAVDLCKLIWSHFRPERLRLVQFSFHHDGRTGTLLTAADVDQIRGLAADVVTIDGRRGSPRRPNANGLFLADFFDFG